MTTYSNLDCCILGSDPGFVTGCPARFKDTEGHDCQRVFSNECTGDALFGSKCSNYCKKHADECIRRKAAYCRTSNDPQCNDVHPGQDKEDADNDTGDEDGSKDGSGDGSEDGSGDAGDGDGSEDGSEDGSGDAGSGDGSEDGRFPLAAKRAMVAIGVILLLVIISVIIVRLMRKRNGN